MELSDLMVALKDLSWSDVKLMALHLSSHNLMPALETIEQTRPSEQFVLYAMKEWLHKDCSASWAKVVSALRVISKNVLAMKIETKYCSRTGKATNEMG